MSLYIVTLDEIRKELGITDTGDDANLAALLEGLQSRFDSYLRRTLLRAANVTERFDGGGTWLLTMLFPIESVASVHVDADQTWGEDALIPASDYVVHTQRGRLALKGGGPWEEGFQNIRVIYTGGYLAGAAAPAVGQYGMPEAIRRAIRMQAGFEWRNRSMLGQQSVSAQGTNINLAKAEMLPEVKELLDDFKRV